MSFVYFTFILKLKFIRKKKKSTLKSFNTFIQFFVVKKCITKEEKKTRVVSWLL